jgi:hypothetical protein
LQADILIIAIAICFAAQICVFTATTKQSTIGIVYGANSPLSGAIVTAEPADDTTNGSGFAITDSSGGYTMTDGLTAGSYNVTAFHYGYIEGEVDFVDVTAGQTNSSVDIFLPVSGGISGTVTDALTGNPINGTDVYAYLANGTGIYGFYGTTGVDGKYLMATNLATGTYNVTILAPPSGYITGMTQANVVAGVETTGVNFALNQSGTITGTVTAPNGTGLYGISVFAASSSGTYYGSATTDMNGNYKIDTGLGTDSYTVIAEGDGNGTTYGGLIPTPVAVTAGQTTSGINMELTPVTVTITPSGTITGTITDQSTGNPISGASVSASGTGGIGSAVTDSNGFYNISSGLGTGTDYNVSVTATGYVAAYYPSLVSVTVGQITSDINIAMTPEPASQFGTITGTVTGGPNPITTVPEFQYPLMAMLSLTLVAAVAGRSMLKTKRYKKTNVLK